MNNKERAKQFMPFDALKGLKEALKEKEERRTRVDKKQITEEVIEAISKVLQKIEPGYKIRIVFYAKGHYIDLQGTVVEKNVIYRFLKIGNERIYFDDILKIKIIDW